MVVFWDIFRVLFVSITINTDPWVGIMGRISDFFGGSRGVRLRDARSCLFFAMVLIISVLFLLCHMCMCDHVNSLGGVGSALCVFGSVVFSRLHGCVNLCVGERASERAGSTCVRTFLLWCCRACFIGWSIVSVVPASCRFFFV